MTFFFSRSRNTKTEWFALEKDLRQITSLETNTLVLRVQRNRILRFRIWKSWNIVGFSVCIEKWKRIYQKSCVFSVSGLELFFFPTTALVCYTEEFKGESIEFHVFDLERCDSSSFAPRVIRRRFAVETAKFRVLTVQRQRPISLEGVGAVNIQGTGERSGFSTPGFRYK